MTKETENKIREDFKKEFAIEVTPNDPEKQTAAFLTEQYWQQAFLDKIADFFFVRFQALDKERVEQIREMLGRNKRWGEVIELAYDEALEDVLTNIFNVEK